MNIEIKKLTPELADDYVLFLIQHRTTILFRNTSVTVSVGAAKSLRTKIFPQPKKEDNMPTNMSKKVLFRDI